jgi:hypothetical protein
MKLSQTRRLGAGVLVTAALAVALPASAAAAPFLAQFSTVSTIASAVPTSGPAAGDQNPYGVAVVPRSAGDLVRGNVLVSNFNDGTNAQGTGSSIMEIAPNGTAHVFAVVPPPTATPSVGLTTALVVLRSGFVVVGSLPAPGGMSSAATGGALSVLDSTGHVVKTITGGDINGPWDMTAVDKTSSATLFVTNVLNGTVKADGNVVHDGTVVRIQLLTRSGRAPEVRSNHIIADGFAEQTSPSALVVGPTGVGLGDGGALFVADSLNNRVAAVPGALTRTAVLHGGGVTISSGGKLNDPLGLAIAPNGDIITMNGNDGRAVETSPAGVQVFSRTLVDPGAGDLFGLAVAPDGDGLYFSNDAGSGPAANSLDLLH